MGSGAVVVTTARNSNPRVGDDRTWSSVSSFCICTSLQTSLPTSTAASKTGRGMSMSPGSGTEDEFYLSYADRALAVAGGGGDDDDADSPVLGRWTEVDEQQIRRRKSGE